MSVALILGAGRNVGKSVASKLVENGYRVGLVSRSGAGETTKDLLPIKADVSSSTDIRNAFLLAERELGAPASVVVYNAASFTPLPVAGEPFSLLEDTFLKDLVIGGLGAYPAIQFALSSFRRLKSPDQPKVFIATSNLLGVSPASPKWFSLGAQKRTLAYLIEVAAKSPTYSREGFRFYLATQTRNRVDHPGAELSGFAHSIAYWKLIEQKEQGDWDIRFDKDGQIF